MSAPTIKPIKLKDFSCKQSSYNDVVPKLPMRSMLCGPNSSGKTVLLSHMILDIYRGYFQEIICGVHQLMLIQPGYL